MILILHTDDDAGYARLRHFESEAEGQRLFATPCDGGIPSLPMFAPFVEGRRAYLAGHPPQPLPVYLARMDFGTRLYQAAQPAATSQPLIEHIERGLHQIGRHDFDQFGQ